MIYLNEYASVPVSRDLKPKSPLAGRLIRRALSRLEPDHPKFTASEQVREALSDPNLRRYLETWVIPQLEGVMQFVEGTASARDLDEDCGGYGADQLWPDSDIEDRRA